MAAHPGAFGSVRVARLLLDEMLSGRIAEQLRASGHDVYAIVERPNLVQLPDEQVLALGSDALWTSQGREHAGLLLLSTVTFPQDRSFVGAVLAALDAAAQLGELPGPGETRFLAR